MSEQAFLHIGQAIFRNNAYVYVFFRNFVAKRIV